MNLRFAVPMIIGLGSFTVAYAADPAPATPATTTAAPAPGTAKPATPAKSGNATGKTGSSPTQQSNNLSDQDKISYSIGVDLGNNFKQQNIKITEGVFMQGIKDGQNGESKLMSKDEIMTTLKNLQKQLSERHADDMKKQAENNLKQGEEFLSQNKSKPGVITLPSGLQYKILEEGKGSSPKADDVVTTHYRGTFIDGTEFDSSYKRNEPASFPVNAVIPGWTEALQLMKPGSKWELFVPSKLGYGEHGAGNMIGPNQTLIFEVQLLSSKPKDAADKPTDTKKNAGKPQT